MSSNDIFQTSLFFSKTTQGRNLDAGSLERDVTVYIGTEKAVVGTLGEEILTFTLPNKDPGRACIDGNKTSDTCVVVSTYLMLCITVPIQYKGSQWVSKISCVSQVRDLMTLNRVAIPVFPCHWYVCQDSFVVYRLMPILC